MCLTTILTWQQPHAPTRQLTTMCLTTILTNRCKTPSTFVAITITNKYVYASQYELFHLLSGSILLNMLNTWLIFSEANTSSKSPRWRLSIATCPTSLIRCTVFIEDSRCLLINNNIYRSRQTQLGFIFTKNVTIGLVVSVVLRPSFRPLNTGYNLLHCVSQKLTIQHTTQQLISCITIERQN